MGHMNRAALQLPYVKSVEKVDNWELDLEAIYRRHSQEEMSVPIVAFSLNYGPSIAEVRLATLMTMTMMMLLMMQNQSVFFLAPSETAGVWMPGLGFLLAQHRLAQSAPDRRLLWLKKLYIDLSHETPSLPTPPRAAQAPHPHLEAEAGAGGWARAAVRCRPGARNRWRPSPPSGAA